MPFCATRHGRANECRARRQLHGKRNPPRPEHIARPGSQTHGFKERQDSLHFHFYTATTRLSRAEKGTIVHRLRPRQAFAHLRFDSRCGRKADGRRCGGAGAASNRNRRSVKHLHFPPHLDTQGGGLSFNAERMPGFAAVFGMRSLVWDQCHWTKLRPARTQMSCRTVTGSAPPNAGLARQPAQGPSAPSQSGVRQCPAP